MTKEADFCTLCSYDTAKNANLQHTFLPFFVATLAGEFFKTDIFRFK